MVFNNVNFDTYFKNYPDANGYYGRFGGAYLPAELEPAFKEITDAYFRIDHTPIRPDFLYALSVYEYGLGQCSEFTAACIYHGYTSLLYSSL